MPRVVLPLASSVVMACALPARDPVGSSPAPAPTSTVTVPSRDTGCDGTNAYSGDGTVVSVDFTASTDDLECISEAPADEFCAGYTPWKNAFDHHCPTLDQYLAWLAEPRHASAGGFLYDCTDEAGAQLTLAIDTSESDVGGLDILFRGSSEPAFALAFNLHEAFYGFSCCEGVRVWRVWYGTPPAAVSCVSSP